MTIKLSDYLRIGHKQIASIKGIWMDARQEDGEPVCGCAVGQIAHAICGVVTHSDHLWSTLPGADDLMIAIRAHDPEAADALEADTPGWEEYAVWNTLSDLYEAADDTEEGYEACITWLEKNNL